MFPYTMGAFHWKERLKKETLRSGEFKVSRVKIEVEGKGSKDEKVENRVKEYGEQRILGSR
jgi:hypothetical protein